MVPETERTHPLSGWNRPNPGRVHDSYRAVLRGWAFQPFSPETPHDVVDGNHFLDGESLKFRIGVTLQKIERLDDWAMALVVRAKFQTLKDFGDHAAVMPL